MKKLATIVCLLFTACSTVRLPIVRLQNLKLGMTVDEVRAELGPPLKLVLHPMQPNRETYRYVMMKERFRVDSVIEADGPDQYRVVAGGKLPAQYREVELVFVDGKLVKE
jgi:hypothetical protein